MVSANPAARISMCALHCLCQEDCGLAGGTGLEIAAGTSVDVAEIDGASNNGVENVREIRENAKYLPQRDRHLERPGRRQRSGRIGEATVLGETAAIATVTLTQSSRFWCAQGKSLNAYLAANPDARHALEHSFNVSLREKLDAMNRAAAPPASA